MLLTITRWKLCALYSELLIKSAGSRGRNLQARRTCMLMFKVQKARTVALNPKSLHVRLVQRNSEVGLGMSNVKNLAAVAAKDSLRPPQRASTDFKCGAT